MPASYFTYMIYNWRYLLLRWRYFPLSSKASFFWLLRCRITTITTTTYDDDTQWKIRGCTVVSLESEATPSATPFFKRAYKISHYPGLWAPWVDLPSFANSSKIWPNISNKVVEKLMLSKSVNNKKCAPKLVFFNEKKIEKVSDDFWHRKFTLKVQY